MPGGAHIGWRVEVPTELASAAEEGDLVELLGVLLDNAAKWARSEVRIGAQAEDGLISLTVEDDGPGIPPQDRRAALTRGVRLDAAVSGTGLGLAIAQDIVAAYGGTLLLEGSALGGLGVQIRLPISEALG
jgi:signal transduction histidine kinase